MTTAESRLRIESAVSSEGENSHLMTEQIKEAEWKVFRGLHAIAVERYCQRVIDEARTTIDSHGEGYHDRYLKLFDLLRRRDKELGRTFDDLKRSNAVTLLLSIKRQNLLTDEEWMRLSAETREVVERIESIYRS